MGLPCLRAGKPAAESRSGLDEPLGISEDHKGAVPLTRQELNQMSILEKSRKPFPHVVRQPFVFTPHEQRREP